MRLRADGVVEALGDEVRTHLELAGLRSTVQGRQSLERGIGSCSTCQDALAQSTSGRGRKKALHAHKRTTALVMRKQLAGETEKVAVERGCGVDVEMNSATADASARRCCCELSGDDDQEKIRAVVSGLVCETNQGAIFSREV